MSHNLKTVASSNECDRVRVSTYCGPRNDDAERSRLQMSQNNVQGHALSSVTLHVTKKQAAALGKQMLEWSQS